MSVPVGSIIASVLSWTDFMANVPAGETWDFADGTSAEGTTLGRIITLGGLDYSLLKENNRPVRPNLNGVFLRGRDYPREGVAQRNPDGTVLVGTYQADDMASHSHGVDRVDGNNAARTGNDGDGWYGNRGNKSDAFGGAETRPRNVTINFFIRLS